MTKYTEFLASIAALHTTQRPVAFWDPAYSENELKPVRHARIEDFPFETASSGTAERA